MGVEITSRSPSMMWSVESQVADVLEEVGRVGAAEDRVEEDPVHLRVDPARGVDVARVRGVERVGDGEVERQAELERGVAGAQLLHDPAVRRA